MHDFVQTAVTLVARSRSATLAAVGALVLCHATVAASADWSLDPKIGVVAQYNDNHRLTDVPGDEIKVSGGGLDAQVTLRSETPTSSFRLIPRLRSTFYPGDSQEETDDQFVRLALQHSGQRTGTSLNADYSRVETLGNYFPGAAIGDNDQLGNPDAGVDIGRVVDRNRQERLAVVPAVSFKLSPRHKLGLGVEYLDVGYDLQEAGDREDYTSLTGWTEYAFQVSPTAALALRAGVGQYEPDRGDATDFLGLGAEWSNRLSETSEWYARGGVTRVQTNSATPGGGTGWETGFSGGAGVRWAFVVTQVFVDVNHYLDPNSSGNVVTRDQLRAELRRRLSELTTVFVGARAISDRDAGGGGSSFQSRKYASANAGFEWRMSRQFSLVGSYDYYWQEYKGAPRDAQSNAVTLGVVYEPKRR